VKVSAAAFACATLLALGVLVLGGTVGSAAVSGSDVTYSADVDWDKGTQVNVNHTAPNNNQLQLNAVTSTFPFIWVALSNRGTIAKIDTATGTILGEYSTGPDTYNYPDPSRTTVSLDGSVWAGNRQGQCPIQITAVGDYVRCGGVIHVGLEEANQCIDRNGNGTIETSGGYGDVLPWLNVLGEDTDGGVSSAQDECILHYTKVAASATRHVTINADGDVWTSGRFASNDAVFELVDGATGEVVRSEGPFNCGGYGGLIDGNGVIWSASSSGAVLRWDPDEALGPENPKCLNIYNYGLAIDPNGNIWVSTLGSGCNVTKLAPDGTVLGTFSQHVCAQGLASDSRGHIWISSSLSCSSNCVVSHLDNDGNHIGSVPISPNAGPTGIAVDSQGKIWSANINSSTASRIDPNAGPLSSFDGLTPVGALDLSVDLPAGPNPGQPVSRPYNYSDMTGTALLQNTSPQGTWTVVQDGGAAGKNWGTVRWNQEAQGSVPAGSSITVEVRASDTEAGLGSQAFVAVSNDTPFALTGRFLEVRVTLRPNQQGQSPVLSDIRLCAVGACVAAAPQPPAAPPAAPPPPPAAVRPPPARTPRAVRRCTVPNVRGKAVRAATRAIVRAGCRTVVMGRRYSATARPGQVLGQSIRPGARVRRGTIVRLVLSRGARAQPARRPPFTG
jgi:hypothetical protein